MIYAGILAAGLSRRFGSPKVLADFCGKEMFRWSIESTKAYPTIVITGEHHKKMMDVCTEAAEFVYNENYKEGIASSIRKLVEIVEGKDCSALLIHLADLPLVNETDIFGLINTYRKTPNQAVASKFDNNFGPPCIFPREMFADLKQLKGDRGAKQLLKKYKTNYFPIKNASIDIDQKGTVQIFTTQSNIVKPF